jgi:hypothetical protein
MRRIHQGCAARPQFDDAVLLSRAANAKNGDKFQRLFAGEILPEYSSASEADLALCCFLAYWTGNNRGRMDSLFRQSGRMRAKWDREDYRRATVDKAIESTKSTVANGAIGDGEKQVKSVAAAPKTLTKEVPCVVELAPEASLLPVEGVHAVKDSQATKLLDLVHNVEVFRAPDSKPYVTILRDGHEETHSIRSKGFRSYLHWRYYQTTGRAISAKAVQETLGVLEGRAAFDGNERDVFYRVGSHGNAIYIDVGNTAWNAIEVTPDGWATVSKPPIKFRRARGMLELPMPARDPHAREHFREMVNPGLDRASVALLTGWVLAAMRPQGPYPVLVLNSEHGSGKTTLAKVLRSLLDPHQQLLRAQPKDDHDLMIAAGNNWVLGLDNLSHLPPWLSDAICRLSTGGGFGTRELFTDEDEVFFQAQRPVILNGIDDIATRGDLADRSVVIELPDIPDKLRMTELAFWRAFEEQRAGVLGYLLDGLACSLRHSANVSLLAMPRMADFVVWVTAAEPAFDWARGYFLKVYVANTSEANSITLDASPIARHILAMAPWSGTASALLAALNAREPESGKRSELWPKSARALSGALRRLRPSFRSAGLEVIFHRGTETRDRQRLISIREVPDA